MNDSEKPHVIIGGRKYVLAEGEEAGSVGPEPEIFGRLSDPPRSVSPSSRLILLLRNGYAPIFGWGFACFGMLFCIVFLPMAVGGQVDLTHRRFEAAGKGEVVSYEMTSTRVNNSPVYKVGFRDAQGNEGNCYTSSRSFDIGEEVDLLKSNGRRKIDGTRLTPSGGVIAIFLFTILLFPVVGVAIVLHGTVTGRRALRLLQDGEIGRARFIDMKPTGTTVNNRPVMKLHYSFTASDGMSYDAYASALDTEKLVDDPVEPLLYDPLDPTRSVLLDSLPCNIRYDEMERTFKAHPGRTILPLFFLLLFTLESAVLVYAFLIGGLIPV